LGPEGREGIDRFVDKDPIKIQVSPALDKRKNNTKHKHPLNYANFASRVYRNQKEKNIRKREIDIFSDSPFSRFIHHGRGFSHLFGFSLILQTAVILSVGIPGCKESGCMLVVFVNGDGKVKMCQQ
jgi:hypothetical protein